ncbi:MAG: hypothetical protein CM15mP12_5510 [Gammaproteobacteria bacterium]|nr:MAG: hypothetical protein CM15mP12_5510 [Gammaproteobacteria bacterium]
MTSFTYLYLGGWAAFYPETYVELIGISINDNVGSSEIRSPIGGVNLLIGLFHFMQFLEANTKNYFSKFYYLLYRVFLLGELSPLFTANLHQSICFTLLF